MAHEILSIKLSQLDDKLGKLHSRIHLSEMATHDQLRQEIALMEHECIASESAFKENLRHSKSSLVSVLARNFEQVEQIIQNARDCLKQKMAENPDIEAAIEEKILLAEYALDFAHLVADWALLISMQAIDAQLVQLQERKQNERS